MSDPEGNDLVIDLTGPEEDDWIKLSPAALQDLALSLPPGTDLMGYLREHPDMPIAKAVLSGQLEVPKDLPQSAAGASDQQDRELLDRLLATE